MLVLKYLAAAAVGLYLLILMAVYFFQGRLLFFPSPEEFKSCAAAQRVGFRFVDEKVSGQRIRALVKETEGALGTLIYFHGNASTACSVLIENLGELSRHPVNFVFAAYPGYENDPATPSQKALTENAETLVTWIRNQPGLGRRAPILFGESLGSGVATFVASRQECVGLILKAPYTSIAEVAAVHYPFLPVKWMIRHPFPSIEWAASVRCPTIVLHGDRDPTIPIQFGRKMAEALGPLARFHTINGAAHNDLTSVGATQFWPPIHAFLRERLTPSP